MEHVQAIFFDVGDTLVFDCPNQQARFWAAVRSIGLPFDPSQCAAAWRRAEQAALAFYLKGVPFDNPNVMRATANTALAEAAGMASLSDREWTRLLAAFVAIPYVRTVHPQAWDMLAILTKRGFTLGIISDWDNDLPDVLRSLGILHFFPTVTTSEAARAAKPCLALFQMAYRTANVESQFTLHVGDWLELDVAGAQAAGMHALLFDHAGRAPDSQCPRVDTFDAMALFLDALPAPDPS